MVVEAVLTAIASSPAWPPLCPFQLLLNRNTREVSPPLSFPLRPPPAVSSFLSSWVLFPLHKGN